MGKGKVDLAVSQAVIILNSGRQQALLPVLEGVGAKPGQSRLSGLAGKDVFCVSHAESTEAAAAKLRRRLWRGNERSLIQAEGVTYDLGNF